MSKTTIGVACFILLPIIGVAVEVGAGGTGEITGQLFTLVLAVLAIAFAVMAFNFLAAKTREIDRKDK